MGCHHAASLATAIKFTFLLSHATSIDFVLGRGPETLPTLPTWGSPKVDCALFRNEAVLRPLFRVWPEDTPGVPFHYCCEYQPDGPFVTTPSQFQLRNYTYGPHDGGTLQPAPYYDLGIVDNDGMGYNLLHWKPWGLPTKQFSVSMLYCDVTDLQRLYNRRLWRSALKRGFLSFIVIFAVVLFLIVFSPIAYLYIIRPSYYFIKVSLTSKSDLSDSSNIYCARLDLSESSERGEEVVEVLATVAEPGNLARVPALYDKEDSLFSDVCHILLLSFVGSCLMEGTAHSPIQGWSAQLLYNVAVTYTYLTLFAVLSTIIRHFLPRFDHENDWRWQKVFGQLVAQMIVGAYLILVDDVSGHGLDAVTGLVLGSCIAASVWSAGVEMLVIMRFCWQIVVKPLLSYAMTKMVFPVLTSIITSRFVEPCARSVKTWGKKLKDYPDNCLNRTSSSSSDNSLTASGSSDPSHGGQLGRSSTLSARQRSNSRPHSLRRGSQAPQEDNERQ